MIERYPGAPKALVSDQKIREWWNNMTCETVHYRRISYWNMCIRFAFLKADIAVHNTRTEFYYPTPSLEYSLHCGFIVFGRRIKCVIVIFSRIGLLTVDPIANINYRGVNGGLSEATPADYNTLQTQQLYNYS